MHLELSEDQVLFEALRGYYAGKDAGYVRKDLEEKYGEAWSDKELLAQFGVQLFDGPRVHVIRRRDGVRGTVGFIDEPRFYFAFIPAQQNQAAEPLSS